MTLNDRMESKRLQHIERRLTQLLSSVNGMQQCRADRISDVMDEIDDLRKTVEMLSERVERMAAFLTTLKNGGDQ